MNKHEDKIKPSVHLLVKLTKWIQPPGRILSLLVLTVLSITSVAYVSNSTFETIPKVSVYKSVDVLLDESVPSKRNSAVPAFSRIDTVEERSDDNFLLKFKSE